MRRVLTVMLGLVLVAVCAYVASISLSGSDQRPPDAVVVPFPRPLEPLPVPEVRIGQGPWADPLPTGTAPSPLPPSFERSPAQVPKFAPTD